MISIRFIIADEYLQVYIDGLVQERRNSIANVLELHLTCINPSFSARKT